MAHTLIVRPTLALLGVRYRRRTLVPRGPCLVVANHNSHLDASVLMSLFPLRRIPHVHPVAAADYFGETWLRQTLAMFLMNAIAIERKPTLSTDPLAKVKLALQNGESLIFFPEGSRGQAGVVAPFRQGVGRIVRAFPGLQVVPVFLSGPERIWPRGQRVPVPLSIDASVGKPREYPVDAEPSGIAEQVRRDVLALAPPPPPVPGPRPAPPVRIAVCGIEPELRRQVFLAVAEQLGRLDRTIGIGTPLVEADDGGVRELAGGIPVALSRAWVGLLARLLRIGGLYKGSEFVAMVERARVDEAFDHGRAGRFVVGDGNPLVDMLAWVEADRSSDASDEPDLLHLAAYLSGQRRIPVRHWWHYIRKAPEVWLLNVLDLAHPPQPKILVLARVTPAETMARIRATGRPLERHENERALARLQEAYGRVARALEHRRKVEVLDFPEGEWRPEDVAARVGERCRERVVRPDAAAPG